MSGCLTAIVMLSTGSVTLGVVAGLAAGTLAGLANGLSITKLGVNSFVTTLGSMVVARGIALIMTGGDVITGLPPAFNFIGVGFLAGIPVPIVIAAVVTVIGHLVLARTEFGLNCYAVGGNYHAAKLAGLRNDRVVTITFTVQGLLAALGGIVMTARVISAQPALMHDTNLDVIAAVVVGGTSLAGGRGSMGGTVLGCILLGALFNGLNIIGVGYEWQLVVIGLIIVMAVGADNLSRR
jgi:ribose transport system permease protein